MNHRPNFGKLFFAFAGFAASVACSLALYGTNFIRLLEWRSVDLRFGIRGELPPDPEIVLIGIDENTFRHLKLKYPFPPLAYARLIEKLRQAGASVIAFDLLYSEPTRECDPPDQDRLLAEVIRKSGNVIWGLELENGEQPLQPIQPIRGALAGVGFLNLPDELDGRIRRVQPQKGGQPALATAILKEFAGFVPADWQSEDLHLINYRGPAGTFPVISMAEILQDRIPRERISNRVCLVGATFASGHDVYATPFHQVSQPNTYGVEIHANILGNMLRGDSLTVITAPHHWAVLLVMAAAISLLLYFGHPWVAAVWWFGASAVWCAWTLDRFMNRQVLFLVLPLLTLSSTFWFTAFMNYLSERRRRKEIRDLFAHYVDPSVVNWLLKNPGGINLQGDRCEVTVLDTDIEGFTAITQNMDPVELVRQLNEYFDAVTDAALSEGGMHDKFVGDALMIIYGFPILQPDHALRALKAAEEIQRRLDRLNAAWISRGAPPFKTRIGICSGEVVMGNVGGSRLKACTAMGDAANLARRIEALNKQFGTYTLIAESTARLLPEGYPLKDLGEVGVAGYSRPIRIFQPAFDRTGKC